MPKATLEDKWRQGAVPQAFDLSLGLTTAGYFNIAWTWTLVFSESN